MRGLPEFSETRYKVWRMLHDDADGPLKIMVDIADTQNKTAAAPPDADASERRPLPRWAITLASVVGMLMLWEIFGRDDQSGVRLLSERDRGGVLGAAAQRAIVGGAVSRACSRSCSAMGWRS